MQAFQIIHGFSGIKSELRTKNRILKPLSELELWFTFQNEVFRAHDYDDHDKCLALANYDLIEGKWRYRLKPGGYGDMLVRDVCETYPPREKLRAMKDLYKLYGYARFRRR
jgi:hypothetical protein